jgi:hypothetical protein
VLKYKHMGWIIVYDGLTLCWCCLYAGVVITELRWISEYVTWRLVTLAKLYSGLRSLTFWSSISVFCCLEICMWNDSKRFILFPSFHSCSSCMVWSAFPYPCQLFSMCNAYAEIGSFRLMYLVCSLCRILIDLPVWPTYELLQVLHFNLYMPLEFILFSCILLRSLLYMLLILKVIFKLVFLNQLATLWVSGL